MAETPIQTEVGITYSVSVRVNLGNYQHGDAFISRSEKWDVSGMDPEEIDFLYQARYRKLQEELGDIIEAEQQEMLS